MIPSIDTYLSREIGEKLEIVLSNRYIIEEILKDIQEPVAKNFIDTYYGPDTTREIPIIYTMPQDKHTQRGAIYIGLKVGEESQQDIGNIESLYKFKTDGARSEQSIVGYDEGTDRLYLEVESPIGELDGVTNISFATSDDLKVEGNRITFNLNGNEDLIGLEFNVKYVATSDKEESGLKMGFTSTEAYSVLAVSTNMDVVRCIDLILKAVFILMRENPEEKNNLLLQKLNFGQIEEVPLGDGPTPEILYGRETTVTYTTSYNLDAPYVNDIKEIIVKRREQS